MDPESARTNPQMTLNRVVFPAPLGPMTPTTSLWAASMETPSSASTPPKPTLRSVTTRDLPPPPITVGSTGKALTRHCRRHYRRMTGRALPRRTDGGLAGGVPHAVRAGHLVELAQHVI